MGEKGKKKGSNGKNIGERSEASGGHGEGEGRRHLFPSLDYTSRLASLAGFVSFPPSGEPGRRLAFVNDPDKRSALKV